MMKKEYQRPETKAYETEIHRMLAMSGTGEVRSDLFNKDDLPDDNNEDIW